MACGVLRTQLSFPNPFFFLFLSSLLLSQVIDQQSSSDSDELDSRSDFSSPIPPDMDDFMMSEKYGGSCRSLAGSMNNGEFDPCYSSGDEDDEDPVSLADLGVFDNVVRQHLKLRPTVSLVMEETEEELAREAVRRASILSNSSRKDTSVAGGESPCEADFGPSQGMGVEVCSVEPGVVENSQIMQRETTPQENAANLTQGNLFG